MIYIDWLTKIIYVPQSYLTPIGNDSYQLDTYAFHIDLRLIESNVDGAVFIPTHNHNTEVSLGGVIYARVIEFINDYTITFEDVGTPYRVILLGSNNNIMDVTNINNVSIASSNSSGLIVHNTSGSSELDPALVWNYLLTTNMIPGSTGDKLKQVLTTANYLVLK